MTMVFVNFPVTDLQRAIEFYSAVGFTQNTDFSNEMSAAMMWDDNFWIMLLTHPFYQSFIGNRKIADVSNESGALIAFALESTDAVKNFGEKAENAGGTVYHIPSGMPEDIMYSLEVIDPDGNTLEPVWMKVES